MAKRGFGEGTIYKRADGRWCGVINAGTVGGKRRRKSFYGATRKEVQEALTKALRDRDRGLPVTTDRSTMEHFLTRWLEDSVKPNVRPSTYESYSDLTRLHIIPMLGHIQLQKLTPHDVQHFVNKKLAEGLSPRTVQYLHALLRRSLGIAARWEIVGRNVASLVPAPRVIRRELHPFTPAQAKQFMDALQGHRLSALFVLLLTLGLRRGEALALLWEDVDLERGTARVSGSLQRLEGKLQRLDVKTEHSKRMVTLPRVTIAALRAHYIRQLEARILAGSRWQDKGYVFTTSIGTPLEPTSVNRELNELLEASELPHMRVHDLRHSMATLMMLQGVPIKVVQESLGHKDSKITMDTYSHVLDTMRQDAADRMDDVLGFGG